MDAFQKAAGVSTRGLLCTPTEVGLWVLPRSHGPESFQHSCNFPPREFLKILHPVGPVWVWVMAHVHHESYG